MRSQTVTVVGLGKIGLPLAVQIAKSGYKVRGADLSSEVVKMINLGTVPFPGEKNLDLYLKEVVSDGSLVATTDTTDAVSNSGFVIVVVPLYVDAEGTRILGRLIPQRLRLHEAYKKTHWFLMKQPSLSEQPEIDLRRASRSSQSWKPALLFM